MMRNKALPFLILTPISLACGLVLNGCGSEDRVAITEVREATPAPPPPPTDPLDNFRAPQSAADGDSIHDPTGRIGWRTPEGWQVLPATEFRDVNFAVEGAPEIEAYFSILPGAAGGLLANINRWRSQMGLEPVAEEALATLPRAQLLEGEAYRVELEGAYSGMQDTAKPGYRLLGLIREDPAAGETYFAKMTGPTESVAEEMAAFEAFAASLHYHGPDQAAAPDPIAQQLQARQTQAGHSQHGHNQGLGWNVPDGWHQAQGPPERVATFHSGDGATCVIVYAAEMRSAREVVAAWRAELGLPPLTDAEWEALPKIEMLGVKTPLALVEAPADAAEAENAPEMMAIASAPLGDHLVAMNMWGAEEAVSSEVDAFVRLCESLHTSH